MVSISCETMTNQFEVGNIVKVSCVSLESSGVNLFVELIISSRDNLLCFTEYCSFLTSYLFEEFKNQGI